MRSTQQATKESYLCGRSDGCSEDSLWLRKEKKEPRR